MKKSRLLEPDGPLDDATFAEALRKLRERFAQMDAEDPPPEPPASATAQEAGTEIDPVADQPRKRKAGTRKASVPNEPTPEASMHESSMHKSGALIAAEKDLWRWELIEQLELGLCGGPAQCQHAECRRAKRCAKKEELEPLMAAARATLEREQAKTKQ